MTNEKRSRRMRQEINYKPGRDKDEYRVLPRQRNVFRRILKDGIRTEVLVGVIHTGQRFCDGKRALYRAMKKVDRKLKIAS